jgi:hypothetical protein
MQIATAFHSHSEPESTTAGLHLRACCLPGSCAAGVLTFFFLNERPKKDLNTVHARRTHATEVVLQRTRRRRSSHRLIRVCYSICGSNIQPPCGGGCAIEGLCQALWNTNSPSSLPVHPTTTTSFHHGLHNPPPHQWQREDLHQHFSGRVACLSHNPLVLLVRLLGRRRCRSRRR